MVVTHVDQGAAWAGVGDRAGWGSALLVAAHHFYQFAHATPLSIVENAHLYVFSWEGAGNPKLFSVLAHYADTIPIQVLNGGFVGRGEGFFVCGALAPFFMCR